ncbi:Uncharacterized protein FKW44_002535 [Caligus rogercresseyi]|uniref:Uncharacterized protein n=1 Tax=Caligus rogercresseyi TaxID=217165 RepID=A0A7T8KKR5_CALRO|nr:Uncharacterized protein FKW44_002535 [Caligus rogercresseyi]
MDAVGRKAISSSDGHSSWRRVRWAALRRASQFPPFTSTKSADQLYVTSVEVSLKYLHLVSSSFHLHLAFTSSREPTLDLAFKSMVLIRGEEYDATIEIRRIKESLDHHNNNLHALLYDNTDHHIRRRGDISSSSSRPRDVFHKSVLYPFIVILILNFPISSRGRSHDFLHGAYIQEAQSSLDPKDCALIVGITYFPPLSWGLYSGSMLVGESFYSSQSSAWLAHSSALPSGDLLSSEVRWIPLPLVIIFTVAFNIGIGSLNWVLATEILPVQSSKWTHAIANRPPTLVVRALLKLGVLCAFLPLRNGLHLGFVFVYVFLPETRGMESILAQRIGGKSLCQSLGQCNPLNKLKRSRRQSSPESTEGFDPRAEL